MKKFLLKRRAVFFALFAALALMWPVGCEQNNKKSGARLLIPETGDNAPAFKIKTLDGKEFSVGGERGKPLVINFWASWCGPCRVEAAPMQKVYMSFKGAGVEFLGVAVQDDESEVGKFINEFKITYPIGIDESGDIMRLYKIFGVPKTYIVGKDGKISYSFIGAISEEELAQGIKNAL